MTNRFKDINSTQRSTKNSHGETIIVMRDSLIAEILLSVIMSITLLSCFTLMKCYVEFIDIGPLPPYLTLITAVLLTIARRLRLNSRPTIFLAQVAVTVVFFAIAIRIPVLQFGTNTANKVYLAGVLIAFTLFSVFYRMKPAFYASDPEFIVFPAGLHLMLYLLYKIAHRDDFARSIIINAIIIAILFIIMRQIAVFDNKYYHSIHKLSKPAKMLKMQNYKTIGGLIVVFIVTLGVLTVFPVQALSDLLAKGLYIVLGLFSLLFMNRDPDADYHPEHNLFDGLDVNVLVTEESLWINIASKILMFVIAIAIIYTILNSLRLIIKNAPKPNTDRDAVEDDFLVDTIEDISPEKKIRIAKRHDFGTGNERRVRKQFYDKTMRAMKKGLPVSSSSTPGQIESVLRENGDKDISALRGEYEKVRYGKDKK